LAGILDKDIQKAGVLSHWIRTKHESISRNRSRSEPIILTPDLVDNIIRQLPPSCAGQANKFVLWLGDNSRPGESVSVRPATHQSIMGAMTPKGFLLVLRHLIDRGLLNPATSSLSDGGTSATLSFEGWQHYEELRRGVADSRRAFMAMKYGDEQLDKLVENVLKPAVRQTGFDLSRLVDTPQPAGLIDDRLRVEIRASRFLIADLTHENAGAYWEAGYAEGLGKPVIYTCEKRKFENSETHFDTNHHLTVLWESEEPGKAAEKLKATIRATLPGEAKLTDDDAAGAE
jgi:nucleoside 2-deoxyribosyltransferase